MFTALAALCGFALIGLPFLTDNLSVGLQPYRWPMLVVGLAAIAAALGSQAVAKNKLFSAGGTAAIVVIFASIFTSPKPSFVYGTIRGTDQFPSVAMMSISPFLIGRVTDHGDFHFFAREEEIKGPIFSITARNTEGASPQLIIIGCIKIDLLKKYLGNSDGLDLTMTPDMQDPNNPRWKLVQTLGTEPLGEWGNPACTIERNSPLKAASLPERILDAFVAPALALDPGGAPSSPPLQGPAEAEAILHQLDQGDFASQIRAQDRVATLRDASSISAVINGWKAPWKVQVDTGLLVAWVRSIRAELAMAVPIASAMSQIQLDHIVELAGSRDYTVRYNATELLSWMLQSTGGKSPPPMPQAQADAILVSALRPFTDTEAFFQPMASDLPSPDHALSAYNAMVALNDAKCTMRELDRKRASEALGIFVASPQVKAHKLQQTSAAADLFRKKQC